MDTHKAFIPFTPGTFASCPPGSGVVVRAGVTKIDKSEIHLDRSVKLNDKSVNSIPYQYLVSTQSPSNMTMADIVRSLLLAQS